MDVFGFGVILYVLLENRFPFCHDLAPLMEAQAAAYKNHCSQIFDTLTDPSLNSFFGPVVANCFAALYKSGEELVKALEAAYESWTDEHRKVSRYESLLIPLSHSWVNSVECERRECS